MELEFELQLMLDNNNSAVNTLHKIGKNNKAYLDLNRLGAEPYVQYLHI